MFLKTVGAHHREGPVLSALPLLPPPHKYEYDWVVGIEISSDNKKMYILNVYLPYDKLDNEEEHIDRLAKLHNILAECDSTCVAVVGDYNANVLNTC